ncbi:MAG: VCBS repeat-containing protein [Flavobacteriaceae bacterium]|nr:VCBS repeat-containing protein [Flavobacteriaceae bacterium]
MKNYRFFFFLIVLFISCNRETPTLFELREDSGIEFENNLNYTNDFNPYTYRNFYNGAGVSVGDINNDGLVDLYITGNMVPNKLYLNKGNFKFQDITDFAGVACENVWSTGSVIVDINGDGFLDIYVCKSGKPGGKKRHNELFINNGDLTFTESSKEYGLDFNGLSVHASFFDYDKDGDLDCYLLSNSIRSVGGFDLIENQRLIPSEDGNKFLVNENGIFIDKSEEVGIYTSSIGFGLGITISDFNGDNWDDIFISNDFFERDYLYTNNQDGTFKEELEEKFKSISMGSMGADAGDLDNDLLPDLFVTEMLPSTIQRKRTKTVFESWDKYVFANSQGYFHQYPRNALQRNMGSSGFFELGRMSGISSTEWSWACLFFDADNDGYKDIFISNGIYKDLLDRDYLTYYANDYNMKNILKDKNFFIKELIDIMPSKPVMNHIYKNEGDFNFKFKSIEWGLDHDTFSNGSAYADFDNDGDQDLVINNVNMPFFIYENKTDSLINKSVKIKLSSKSLNSQAIGTKAYAYFGTKKVVFDNHISKGFQSSIAAPINIGIGKNNKIDSVIFNWPNGSISKKKNLKSNKTYKVIEPEINKIAVSKKKNEEKIVLDLKKDPFKYKHIENKFIDFNRDRLIPEMYSNEGPALSSADVNGDGVKDFFIGGAKSQTGALFVSFKDKYLKDSTFLKESIYSEDTDAIFLDIDQDNDQDLYVCSGGRAFSENDKSLKDRIYINDGKGNFTLDNSLLPTNFNFISSSITSADFNKDGFIDVFVGQRMKGNNYGLPGNGYLLYNSKESKFKVNQKDVFSNIGMVTDVQAIDINNDSWEDIIIIGHWMGIKVFINENGVFNDHTEKYDLNKTVGLWNDIELKDIDKDGDIDIVAGNLGLNTYFKKGDRVYINDFDKNGTIEQILCHKINDKFYPIVDRDELISQLPYLKKKFVRFDQYASASIEDIFDSSQLKNSLVYEIDQLASLWLENKNGKFIHHQLPIQAQYSSIYAIKILDLNNDNINDIVLGGNQYNVKPQFGRNDASNGLLIYGSLKDDKYQLENVNLIEIDGQIRNLDVFNFEANKILIFTVNNEEVKFKKIK